MMHPRNIYSKKPANFGKLGEKYAQFRKHLIPTKCGGHTINFKDPRAVRELTVSLLDNDFGLKVELPLERLIPTVPQKLNYIHWIEDLLFMIPSLDTTEKTKGIDIGTGASCIYALLGAKMNDWMFCASEVDEFSFRFASENVRRNKLEQNIHVELVSADKILQPLMEENKIYDFCMCNPPFFADQSEMMGTHSSRTDTRPQPSSVCTGTGTETVTPGGEVEFVGRMIKDSLELKTRIKWYTTMLGKKSSVSAVVAKLKENNIHNIVTTEFCQGRTTRWGVAWTFLSDVRIEGPPKKRRKNKPLEFTFPAKTFCDVEEDQSRNVDQDDLVSRISVEIRKMLLELEVNIISEHEENTNHIRASRLHCGAASNTWANQRRKRREAARKLGSRNGNEATVAVAKTIFGDPVAAGDVTSDDVSTDLTKDKVIADVTSNCIRIDVMRDYVSTEVTNHNVNVDVTKNIVDVVTDNHVLDNDVNYDVTTDVINHDAIPTNRSETNSKEENTDVVSDLDPLCENSGCDKAVALETDCCVTSSVGTARKRERDSFELTSLVDQKYFLEFVVEVGVKHAEVIKGLVPNVFVRMTWTAGHDRNSLYQLFQYFRNRLMQ